MDSSSPKQSCFVPHPWARGSATLLAIGGTLLSKSLLLLLFGWLGLLLPIIVLSGIARQHLHFMLIILAPIAIALIVVWGWIVGAPPGEMPGAMPLKGVEYAGVIVLRLALLGGIAQLCFLTIHSSNLISTLWMWGLRGNWLTITLASFSLVPELRLRAEQVITARYARGLIPARGLIVRIRQIPYLLLPLTAWVLRSAIQRSEVWQQRALTVWTVDTNQMKTNSFASVFFLLVALVWVSLAFM